MSAWRRHAIDLFPSYKTFLNDKKENLSQLLLEMGNEIDNAVDAKDNEFIAKIFGYAEWCLRNGGINIENQIIPFFYKDIFLFKQNEWDYLLQWVSPWVIHKIKWYIESKLTPDDVDVACSIVNNQKQELYRKNWYFTNAQSVA